MRFDKLLNDVDVYERPADARKLEITNITDDTTEVQPGSLFCCVVGSRSDGHDLAGEAVAKGAVALLVEREVNIDIPQARVSSVRASLAPVAASFYAHPDKHLRMVGITGTNGKTTTTHILASILQRNDWKTATIGTLSGQYTSPPAPKLQQLLGGYRDQRYNAVVMEVSSHALVQHRVDAIRYRAAVFTNLTQDHLDYHKTMNAYFEAKSLLFDPGRTERAVINMDDPYGRQLTERVAIPVYPYSLEDAVDLKVGPVGSSFVWQGHAVHLPLVGVFNVHNALAAATTARSLGVSSLITAQALNDVPNVPGRMERIDVGQPFTVIVDFAHTPDGLQNVLNAARPAAQQRDGRVLVVFGCGGDRDVEKRPQMGSIAEQLADGAIITSDNPRSEDPAAIAKAILGGITRTDRVQVELDRKTAIEFAVGQARPGDVVVIAGKGHETTQEVGGVKTPFDDRLVAAAAIEELRPA